MTSGGSRAQRGASLALGLLFLVAAVVFSLLGYTVVPVDQYARRDYNPWAEQSTEMKQVRGWNYKDYRNGDAVFLFPYIVRDHLEVMQHQQPARFSYTTILGFPQGPEADFSRGLSPPLARWVAGTWPEMNLHRVSYITMNLTAGFWGMVAFALLWLLAQAWWGRPMYGALLGFAANPVLYIGVEESFLVALVGVLGVTTAVMWGMRAEEQKKGLPRLLALVGGMLGAVMVARGGVPQFYLYLPLLYLFAAPYLIRKVSLRFYVLFGTCCAMGYVIELPFFLDLVATLNASSKAVGEAPSLLDRGYALFPIESIMPLPVVEFAVDRTANPRSSIYVGSEILVDVHRFLSGKSAHYFIGFPVAALALIGWTRLKDVFLKGFILVVVLYHMGPVQYLLAISVGGPFATESSIRMIQVVYVMVMFLAVFALHQGLHEKQRIWLLRLVYAVFGITLFQVFFVGYKYGQVWAEGTLQLFVLGVFYLFLTKEEARRSVAVVAILLCTVSVSKGFVTENQTVWPYPMRVGEPPAHLLVGIDIDAHSVGALVMDAAEPRGMLHPHFWYDYGVKSIHAYRNPYPRRYAYLYWYQWLSNQPGGIPEGDLEDELRLPIKQDFLLPVPVSATYAPATQRFFDLTGISLLASGSLDTLAVAGTQLVRDTLGVKIWTRDLDVAPFRVVSTVRRVSGVDAAIRAVFEPSLDLATTAVVEGGVTVETGTGQVQTVAYEGDAVAVTVEGAGLLCTNIPYYQGLVVEDMRTGERLPTMVTNGAFLGVALPGHAEPHTLRIRYERPLPWARGHNNE